MESYPLEINVKGKWVKVPALDSNGKTITVRGKWIKVAYIHDEWWLDTELEDPEACVKKLKEQRLPGLRADIFTFTQKLPGSVPKYGYEREWDSVATVRTTSFQEWWEKLPQESRKNVRRSQKRGLEIGIKPFDDDLIKGIIGVNNDSPTRQGGRNVQYGKSFDQVKRDYSAFLDRSDFICAFLGLSLIHI